MCETRHSLNTPLKIPADTEVAEVICLDTGLKTYYNTYSTTEALHLSERITTSLVQIQMLTTLYI